MSKIEKYTKPNNATKHGITGNYPPVEGEADFELYQRSHGRIYSELQPADIVQEHLCEVILMCIVKQHRIWAAEAIFTGYLSKLLSNQGDGAQGLKLWMSRMREWERQLELFQRYETTNSRKMHRAIDQLRELKRQPLSLN